MSERIGSLAFALLLAGLAVAWPPGTAQGGVTSVCGDGVEEGNESCDDGNTLPCDGCPADCFDDSECGDGVVQLECEECDDNNTNSGDGCDFCADCGYTGACG